MVSMAQIIGGKVAMLRWERRGNTVGNWSQCTRVQVIGLFGAFQRCRGGRQMQQFYQAASASMELFVALVDGLLVVTC